MFHIAIESRQQMCGQHDCTRLTAVGHLTVQDGQAVLSYTEEAEDGARTNVTLRATDSEVLVQRGGVPPSLLRLQQGRRCTCDYATPYGSFAIVTHTHRIENCLSTAGGTLSLVYDLEFSGGITETTLHLSVKKTEESPL